MDTTADVDHLLADAAEAAGLDDFGDTWFLGPLSAYVADLDQPNLTQFGQELLRSRAVGDVARRLRVLATLREHPEIASVPIPPIVYVTGLERAHGPHRRRSSIRWATTTRACGATRSSGPTASASASSPSGRAWSAQPPPDPLLLRPCLRPHTRRR